MTRRVNNDRGLGRYGESDVIDSRRQTIRIQDSSTCSDDGPCVWIFCNDEDGRDFVEHPPAPRGIVVRSPHLTAKQAVEVANRLLEFVELAAPEALGAAVIPGRPDFHETCRNYESALDYGVQEAMDITAENERLRADLASVTGERDAAIASALAAQSQATQSVLDATARADALERERDEARDELATLRGDRCAYAQGAHGIAGCEKCIDCLKRANASALTRAAAMGVSRDHWRTVAESRPDISREDAAAFLVAAEDDRFNDFVEHRNRIIYALRAHAAAPKGDGGSDDGAVCEGCGATATGYDLDGVPLCDPCGTDAEVSEALKPSAEERACPEPDCTRGTLIHENGWRGKCHVCRGTGRAGGAR